MVSSSLAPGRMPEGRRAYVVGDVHGCLDRLVSLHWQIARDLAANPVRDSVLVHLGDYVDRGTDSAGVLWLLGGALAAPVTRRVDLRGNHELLMVDALSGNDMAAGIWLDNGGEMTLRSYGVPDTLALRPDRWAAHVPAAHLSFIRGLDMMHREGNYLFVHAGIRPGVPIRAQKPEDLLWIREPFLSDRTPRDVVVVHGHTPRPEVEVFENRIGIDTGAVMGGALTCLVLEADQMRFLSA
jgi:serine/threonine protein phosphatase 1